MIEEDQGICICCGGIFCDKCVESFIQNENLSEAKKREHNSHEIFDSTLCSETFGTDTQMKEHSRKHNGKLCHKCDHCGESFSQKVQLKTHLRQQHGEIAHQCTVCGKGFSTKEDWQVHMREHNCVNLHQCNQCGKSFNTVLANDRKFKLESGTCFCFCIWICLQGCDGSARFCANSCCSS